MASDVFRYVGMHDHHAATRALKAGRWTEEGLSAQQLFERGRDLEALSRPAGQSALRRALGAVVRRREAEHDTARPALPRHLAGLEGAGCVTLHDLRASLGRVRVDHLVVAPAGVFVVDDRPWRGQVSVHGDALYIDGRRRYGVAETARDNAARVQQDLADELTSFGLGVTPVICLPTSEVPWQVLSVQGVLVAAGRGLVRHLRQAPAVMGRDTVVRVALAADRLLGER